MELTHFSFQYDADPFVVQCAFSCEINSHWRGAWDKTHLTCNAGEVSYSIMDPRSNTQVDYFRWLLLSDYATISNDGKFEYRDIDAVINDVIKNDILPLVEKFKESFARIEGVYLKSK